MICGLDTGDQLVANIGDQWLTNISDKLPTLITSGQHW